MPEPKINTFSDLIAKGLLEIGDGYRAKLEELGGDGPIFLRAGQLTGRGIIWEGVERFHGELVPQVGSKLGRPGDTVITTKGNSTGRVGYVPHGAPSFVYSPHLSYWRSADPSRLSPQYLRYWSRSPEFMTQLKAMAGSTDMAPYLSLGDQKRLCITIPHINTQHAIGAVLGAFDSKIAVNERITATCDQLRALQLDEWLKANRELAAERPLTTAAEFINGRPFTKEATGTGRMVVRIAEINSGPGPSTVYNDIKVPDVHLAWPGDVLFAWSGSLIVTRWFRPEAIINQHIFKVIPRGDMPPWLVFEIVQRELTRFKGIAADKATTMGHIQRRHLDDPVIIPAQNVMSKLDAFLSPLWGRALSAEKESLVLAELRDTLLPGLMSGEIRVREAEKVVEEVT